jgi:hypothetical protein
MKLPIHHNTNAKEKKTSGLTSINIHTKYHVEEKKRKVKKKAIA